MENNPRKANRRLFVGGIPDNKTLAEVWQELHAIGMRGICDVIMYRAYTDPNLNRGFVFVEFTTHQEAAMARIEHKFTFIFGQRVRVDWSTPLNEVPENVLNKVKKIYLRNLSIYLTRDDLTDLMVNILKGIIIEKVYKYRDYAFIHFKRRSEAEKAISLIQEHYKGTEVEVCWAKPPPLEIRKMKPCNTRLALEENFDLYAPSTSSAARSREPMSSLKLQNNNWGPPRFAHTEKIGSDLRYSSFNMPTYNIWSAFSSRSPSTISSPTQMPNYNIYNPYSRSIQISDEQAAMKLLESLRF